MTTYDDLNRQYLFDEITETEFKEQEERYISMVFDLYLQDIITEEELKSWIK